MTDEMNEVLDEIEAILNTFDFKYEMELKYNKDSTVVNIVIKTKDIRKMN